MALYIFCDEIGSDWGIVLIPQMSDDMELEDIAEFEAALGALVNLLNAGLARIGESGRVSLKWGEQQSE